MSGYNENGWNDPESMGPFGDFINLPSGVTEPEEGVLYIEKLKAQDKSTITIEGMIPQDYNKENVAFSFAAMSYGKEDFDPATDIPVLAVTHTLIGKVVNEAEENPKPGTENQKSDNVNVQSKVKNSVNKNQVPKTGDESSANVIFMIMAVAGVTAVIARRKVKV